MILLLFVIMSLSFSTMSHAADAKAGAAKAAVCVACHMPNGCSVNPIWPKLANELFCVLNWLSQRATTMALSAGISPIPTISIQQTEQTPPW